MIWRDGSRSPMDAVIWCTGFGPALGHLAPLGVLGPDGRVAFHGGRSTREPRLWLVGYGDWAGIASATLAAPACLVKSVEEVDVFVPIGDTLARKWRDGKGRWGN